MIFDTHCHLNDKRLINETENIVSNFKNDNLLGVITVGYDLDSSIQNLEIANKYNNVYCAVGIHPHDSKAYDNNFEDFLKENISNKKIVALGEIGLDYYYDNSPRDIQKQVFIQQLKLADKYKLPIILHNRESTSDLIEILTTHKHLLSSGGVLHCFNGSLQTAKQIIELGLCLGFGGTITYKGNKVVEVIKELPLESMVLETDSPYLPPMPFRGKTNYPKHTNIVLQKMCDIFEMPKQELQKIFNSNVKRIFKIN